jgi:hypothetical protein
MNENIETENSGEHSNNDGRMYRKELPDNTETLYSAYETLKNGMTGIEAKRCEMQNGGCENCE